MKLKSLERASKALFLRAAARTLPAPARAGPPDWSARPIRVLYLRHGRIGDMILSTGILRALAASHPTITLDVLAAPSGAAVLEGNPHVASIIAFERRSWSTFPRLLRRLRRARYDAVVDPMVLSPSTTSVLLMLASRACYRVGVGGRKNDFIYTLPVTARAPSEHHVHQEGAVLDAFGVDPARTDLRCELHLAREERAAGEAHWQSAGASDGTRLLVNVSAYLAHRFWPDDRYVALLRHAQARARPPRLLVIGDPKEWERVARIAAEAEVPAVNTPIRGAMALVATSDVVATPDTSIAHMAAAFRKPVVVMLVGAARIFAPYGNTGRDLYSPGPTLHSLPVETVAAAIDDVLDERAAH